MTARRPADGSAPLSGRRAVVTGGGRGIGRAIALLFADNGAEVVVTGRTSVALGDVAVEAESLAGTVHPIVCDVSDDDSVAHMAETVRERIGAPSILVNNAGIHAGGRFLDIAPETYASLYDVNVIGAVRVTQQFAPDMIEAGWGRIVNIASTAGLFESAGQAPYNASKHAMVGLTRCIALEFAARGVTCNAICPGFVDTEMIDGFAASAGADAQALRAQLASRTPMGRMLDPSEIAHMALYIVSEHAGGMTGQAMAISNGMRMR